MGRIKSVLVEAAIAQWIRLRLLTSSPRFESQAHLLRFYSQILYYICHCIVEKDENKQKEALFGTY